MPPHPWPLPTGGRGISSACHNNFLRLTGPEPIHLPEAEPERPALAIFARLQRAIPNAVINVDRVHLNPMLAGAADNLRRRVKTHGLRIQEPAGEDRRVMAFEPG
ncbi:hypothetical protein MnTg02_01218 [bacterium MnTg02]|nr:hypothetical protein MnTg02_01218 [bacterium MnTg02]